MARAVARLAIFPAVVTTLPPSTMRAIDTLASALLPSAAQVPRSIAPVTTDRLGAKFATPNTPCSHALALAHQLTSCGCGAIGGFVLAVGLPLEIEELGASCVM